MVKKFHPDIAEPFEWTEAAAVKYVSYTCQALRGELRHHWHDNVALNEHVAAYRGHNMSYTRGHVYRPCFLFTVLH